MKISKLIIKSSSGKYPILIGPNVVSNISKLMFNNSINFEKCLLVVDKNVPKKFISKIKKSLKNKKLFIFLITANEKNKNQKTTNSILQILLDKNFFNIIKLKSPFIDRAIYESCKIKKLVVEKDEKENGMRKVLNFGHTFAHAYEASLGFSRKLNHGEAVILGMNTALSFSYKNKFLNFKEYNLIREHIYNSKLPFNLNKYFSLVDLNKILNFMMTDKKNNSNKINLVLLKKIGRPIISKRYKKAYLALFLKKELIN